MMVLGFGVAIILCLLERFWFWVEFRLEFFSDIKTLNEDFNQRFSFLEFYIKYMKKGC